jgi:UDP-glucose 4-epimerase
VFVSDVVRANVCVLKQGDGEILNVGTGIGTTTNEIFTFLNGVQVVEGSPVFVFPRIGDIKKSILDVQRVEELLGWQAQVSIKDGLHNTLVYYKSKCF